MRYGDSPFPLNFLLSYSDARAGNGALASVPKFIYPFPESESKISNFHSSDTIFREMHQLWSYGTQLAHLNRLKQSFTAIVAQYIVLQIEV